MFNKLKAAGKSLAAGDLKGAQSNLNLKGGQTHETQPHATHATPATASPSALAQEGAASKDQQAADLNKVKDGLSKRKQIAKLNQSVREQVDLHAAINVGRDLQHGNMHHLAHDAAHLKKADPNAPELPEAERLAKEQKKSNMKGAMQFLKDLKRGNLLNATEDALNLSENNARYQKQADELARQKEAEARQARGHNGESATAHAVAAQAVAVQNATAPVAGHATH